MLVHIHIRTRRRSVGLIHMPTNMIRSCPRECVCVCVCKYFVVRFCVAASNIYMSRIPLSVKVRHICRVLYDGTACFCCIYLQVIVMQFHIVVVSGDGEIECFGFGA